MGGVSHVDGTLNKINTWQFPASVPAFKTWLFCGPEE
jgi:hypothetical protein